MPATPIDPEGLQRQARGLLTVSPSFTGQRARGPVSPASVPADTRERLEASRKAFLRQIVDDDGFARRLNEAVEREDRDAIRTLSRQGARSDDVEVTITGVDADFWFHAKGCLFGFCWELSFGW